MRAWRMALLQRGIQILLNAVTRCTKPLGSGALCEQTSASVCSRAPAAALALGLLYGIVAFAAAEASAAAAAALPASEAPQPQQTAEGTVRELYADEVFFHLRNTFPRPMVQRFSACLTPELIEHLEAHNQDVDRWFAQHADETLKLPMAAGPIFFSNYEGADSFEIGQATTDGTHAQVPVSFTYSEGADTVRWVDVVMLHLVGGVWLMDDILFDPQRWDHYTLRERVALDE